MEMLNSVSNICGNIFIVCGGVLSMALILAVFTALVGEVWIMVNNKWRRIVRAESLIHEYKKEREQYLAWKECKKGGNDNA